VGVSPTCAGVWGNAFAYYDWTLQCQCNDRCAEFKNCCPDYKDWAGIAVAVVGSGDGAAGGAGGAGAATTVTAADDDFAFCSSKGCPDLFTLYQPDWPCQCNALCLLFGNCCVDAREKCVLMPQ